MIYKWENMIFLFRSELSKYLLYFEYFQMNECILLIDVNRAIHKLLNSSKMIQWKSTHTTLHLTNSYTLGRRITEQNGKCQKKQHTAAQQSNGKILPAVLHYLSGFCSSCRERWCSIPWSSVRLCSLDAINWRIIF